MVRNYYICYSRVSTKKQEEFGYSLGFQESEMEQYAKRHRGVILEKYHDVVTGTSKRKYSNAILAIERCKATNSTLLVYKLDRLCRDVLFLQHLFSTGIKYIFMDQPGSTNLNLNILMSIAEYEAQMASERTKIGMKYAKLAGKKIGSPQNLTRECGLKGNAVRRENSLKNVDNLKAYAFAKQLREQGYSYGLVTDTLNKNHFTTPSGKWWTINMLYKLIKNFDMYLKVEEKEVA